MSVFVLPSLFSTRIRNRGYYGWNSVLSLSLFYVCNSESGGEGKAALGARREQETCEDIAWMKGEERRGRLTCEVSLFPGSMGMYMLTTFWDFTRII